MKISITKKILGMVIVPILFISVVVGVAASEIMKHNVTDEIEARLKTGAYSVSQTLELCSDITDVDADIRKLFEATGIDVTVFDGNAIRIASTINGAVGTSMDGQILAEIKTGKDYFATDANVNGQPYFGYYIPFVENGEFSGSTFTGIPQKDANQTIFLGIVKIVGSILICGIVAILVAMYLVRKITTSIDELKGTVGTLLDNDLSVTHEKHEFEHDEIEEICNKAAGFSEQLNKIVTKIKEAGRNLKEATAFSSQTSGEIAKAIEDVSQGAAMQAEDTTNSTHKVGLMSEHLNAIKDNADSLNDIADDMNETKDNVLGTLAELQDVNGMIVQDVNTTNEQVNITSESVRKIQKVVNVIKDIAGETKLLSLNASIEAAKAGEAGRGFAVVAENIRRLAGQSAQSSDDIEEILVELEKNYDKTILSVEKVSGSMSMQIEKLTATRNAFTVLDSGIGDTVGKIVEIKDMVESLNEEIKTMVDMISNLSAISQENSAATQETMAAIEELNAIIHQVDEEADKLMNEVDVFKTE